MNQSKVLLSPGVSSVQSLGQSVTVPNIKLHQERRKMNPFGNTIFPQTVRSINLQRNDSYSISASGTEQSSKPAELYYSMESLSNRIIDSRYTINSIVNTHLFPRVKFINKDQDLAYTDNKRSICQFVLKYCHISPSIDKKEWWQLHSKFVYKQVTALRSSKSSSLQTAFYGKFYVY